MKKSEFHVDIDSENMLAAPTLAGKTKLSLGQIKLAMKKGAVWLTDKNGTHRIRRAKKCLPPGSTIHFYFNPDVLSADIPPPTLISDEGGYSIWFKPRGVLSQGSKWGDHCTIYRWIENNDVEQRPAIIVHRLDRAACGLIVIAHSKLIAKKLAQLFQLRAIEKRYQALVVGKFSDNSELITINTPVENRNACSKIKLLEYYPDKNISLLEVQIETGRKHQIRRHLSEAGFPIAGDRLYGGGDKIDLQLAAVSLKFLCPESDAPKEFYLPQELKPNI